MSKQTNQGSIVLANNSKKFNNWAIVGVIFLVCIIFAVIANYNINDKEDEKNPPSQRTTSSEVLVKAGELYSHEIYLEIGEEITLDVQKTHFHLAKEDNLDCFEFKMGNSKWYSGASGSVHEFATQTATFRRIKCKSAEKKQRLRIWNVEHTKTRRNEI
jgi:hypothetical protein